MTDPRGEALQRKPQGCACRFEWRPMPDFSGAPPKQLDECGFHAEQRRKLHEWQEQVRLTIRGIDGQAERLTKLEQTTFRDGYDQAPRDEDFEEIITGYKLNTGLWHRLHGLLASYPASLASLSATPANARAVAEKCDPAMEADRSQMWEKFAVHGGPQGPFMLYGGFRDALKYIAATLPEAPQPATPATAISALQEAVNIGLAALGHYNTEQTDAHWNEQEKRLRALAQSETPAGGAAKVPERETRHVYKADAEEYRSYITARFEKANSGYRFRWQDREWRYEHSDFDERGDFDLLLAAAPAPDNEETK